jgi:outer membrane immunogenic protein
MKKLFLGSVALVALGLGAPAAFAAERPVPAPAYASPPPVPVYTWSGCYAGANAGYSAGRSTQTTVANSILTGGGLGVPAPAPLGLPGGGVIAPVPAGSSIAGDLNLSGFIGGFQGGCNYQWGTWVIGFEGDGMATNKEGQNFETGLVPFLGNGRANWISQTQERWLVTARGKLGMTWWDKSMVYVTGGAAWAKIDTSEFLIGAQTGTGHQESNTRTGWTVGAGYEYALGYGWSIKGEYLYVKFDDYTTFTQPPFGGLGLNIAPRSVKLYDNVIRAGMNYKFW